MPRLTRTILASSTALMLAPAAFADLSADAVWNDWQAYVTGLGYGIDGQVSRDGDTLTISGVTVSSTGDRAPGGANIAMDRIVMTEMSDGTVRIDLPAIMPVEMSSPTETGVMTRVSMDYRQTGLEILASGTENALQYDYKAESIDLKTTGIEVNGKVLPPEANAIQLSLEDVSGITTSTVDSHRRYDQNLDVASMRYHIASSDSTSGSASDVSGTAQDLTFSGQTTAPLRAVDITDADAMLAAGFTGDGAFSYAANALTLNVSAPSGASEASVISGAGSVDISMASRGLTYDVAQSDLKVEMTTNQFPLPIAFDVAQASFNITMPLRKSDTPEDFALGFTLNGFSMSDALWGIFDPSAQLPRDPATIALDLAGKARLLFNFLNPTEAAAIAPDEAPAEIQALDIRNVQISAVGAELTGAGAFKFDNTEDGPPKPQGVVDLTLTGANALLDKLVATGLLPDEQAMGTRMMMGLLAVPGDAPDTLNSKIEVNDQGHVLANGQRIQ